MDRVVAGVVHFGPELDPGKQVLVGVDLILEEIIQNGRRLFWRHEHGCFLLGKSKSFLYLTSITYIN